MTEKNYQEYQNDFEFPESTQGAQITNAAATIAAISTGTYKNIAYALSELIDNAIDNDAKNINLITYSELGTGSGKQKKRITKITEIAILDDGIGMDYETLRNCLSLGYGTNLDSSRENNHGKFGYGLKGSSLFACRRVEVFSWQQNTPSRVIYLDKDKIKSNQERFPDPVEMEIPEKYKKLIKKESTSGTLVIWKKLNETKIPKKIEAFKNLLKNDVCRIYRHYLDDDDAYGGKLNITITSFNDKEEKAEPYTLLPNDPLFLMKPNILEKGRDDIFYGDQDTSIEEGKQTILLEYEKGKMTPVQIITSVAKPEIQKKVGSSYIGKKYESNNSISFLRQCREIDFEKKGYIAYEERSRWFGVEVRFTDKADEIFGVTKEKTQVQNIKKLSNIQNQELKEEIDDYEQNEDFDKIYYERKGLYSNISRKRR